MPFSLGLLPAGEKNEGRTNVMDKIAAQTWFSCSIYYSRSEVLYEILGNVKNSEFVRPKQQLHISPASTQNSAVFSTWTWSSSKNWPQEWRSLLLAGNLTPNASHKPSQPRFAWRAAAFPTLEGGCITPGVARGIIWWSGGAGASASLSSSEDSESQQPGSLGKPLVGWVCREHQAPAGARTRSRSSQWAPCRAAGCRQALWQCRREARSPSTLWAPSLFAQMHPEIEPCFLPPDKCFPQQCYCFFGCYFSCVVIYWCTHPLIFSFWDPSGCLGGVRNPLTGN